MSSDIEDPGQCEGIQEDLTEFALGILSGRRRSEVLSHVESCRVCNSELRQLSIAADALVQLGPEVEPPLAFESRLAQRLQARAIVRPPKHLRRRSALAAAAVVTAVLGFGIGTLTTTRGSNHQRVRTTANLTSASLNSRGHVLGEVLVSAGKPSWIFMSIDSGNWSGVVTCQVIVASGKVDTIGQFKVSSGYSAWGAPMTASAGQVRSARLIAANGAVLASAHLPA